jgi:hypothetical protein
MEGVRIRIARREWRQARAQGRHLMRRTLAITAVLAGAAAIVVGLRAPLRHGGGPPAGGG